MKADPVRRRAHEILIAVAEGQALDQVLAPGLGKIPDARDRGFCAELVRGTLQWQGRYDHVITRFARRKPPTDAPTLCLLRMTLHQMLGQDTVPAYAAIHQAGELCRLRPGVRKVPFVNGLLQSVRREFLGDSNQGPADTLEREKKLKAYFARTGSSAAGSLAAWQSHPEWLVRKWIAHFGRDQAEAICVWNNRPVPLVFHALAPVDPDRAMERLIEAGCPVTRGSGARTLVAETRPGRELLDELLARFSWLIVQDSSVQEAVAWLVGGTEAQSALEGPVLDMCAAPGGKTAFLASQWPGKGRILAMDNRPDRIQLLRGTVKRIETDRVDVVLANGARSPFDPGSFAAVLLDGPCSGTGVLRHHPEGRWRLKKEIPARKGAFLLKLAAEAADLLAPGGLLMYATCSLETEENEEVVDRLLAGRPDLEPAPTEDGHWRRSWVPPVASGDGFFAARIRKKG